MEQLPIRLFCGFKRPELPHDEFLRSQGNVGIPFVMQALGRRLGILKAYLPVIRPERQLPGVPDQVSLLVYDSVAACEAATTTLDWQACQLMQQSAFASPSGSNGFAAAQNQIEFVEQVEFGRTYCIPRRPVADFQKAHLSCLIGRRNPGGQGSQPTDANTPEGFRAGVANAIYGGYKRVAKKRQPDLSIFQVHEDYLVYFEVWSTQAIIPNSECLSRVDAKVEPLYRHVAAPVFVPPDLNTEGHWLHLSPVGDFINLQF